MEFNCICFAQWHYRTQGQTERLRRLRRLRKGDRERVCSGTDRCLATKSRYLPAAYLHATF